MPFCKFFASAGEIFHSVDVAENVASEDYYQRFKALLSEKDMEILELRMEGLTYKEIAERMGYQNHSGVLKRMKVVTETFIQYQK